MSNEQNKSTDSFTEDSFEEDQLSRKDNDQLKHSALPITQLILNSHKSRSISYNPQVPKNFAPHLRPSKCIVCPSPLFLNKDGMQIDSNNFTLSTIYENEDDSNFIKRSKSIQLNNPLDINHLKGKRKLTSMKEKDNELKYNEKRGSMNGTIIKTLESVLMNKEQ